MPLPAESPARPAPSGGVRTGGPWVLKRANQMGETKLYTEPSFFSAVAPLYFAGTAAFGLLSRCVTSLLPVLRTPFLLPPSCRQQEPALTSITLPLPNSSVEQMSMGSLP